MIPKCVKLGVKVWIFKWATLEIPNALRLHTTPWWRVMSGLIHVWISSHGLIIGAVLPSSKAQAMLAARCMNLRDSTSETLTRCNIHIMFLLSLSHAGMSFFFLALLPFFQTSVQEGSSYCMIPWCCKSLSGKCAILCTHRPDWI